MKIDKLIISILLVFLLDPIALKAQDMTTLERIQDTGLLQIGIREDAVPFGYRNADNNLSGLCLDFMALLRQRIQENLQRNVLTIKIFKSTLFNRFDLVEDRVVDVECGPNTINPENERVTFSNFFLITGIQFLIKREDRTKFNFQGSLEGLTIGVLRDSTTEVFLRERYPLATLQLFQGVTGRVRGIQALQRGAIDAFVSDGILLLGEATVLGLNLEENYSIVPQRPLTCDYYGLILPKNDPQWETLVNNTLQVARSELLIADWFSIVDEYLQETARNCQATLPP